MADEIRGYFEAEAEELIARLTRGVAGLNGGELAAAGAQDMLRAAHTLKGAAHVVGEKKLASLAHDFEDGVAAYRAAPTAAGGAGLVAMVDGLAAELKGEAGIAGTVGELGEMPAEDIQAPGSEGKREEKARVELAAGGRAGQTVRVDIAEARRLLDGVAESDRLVSRVNVLLGRLDMLAFEIEAGGSHRSREAARAGLRAGMHDELDRLARGLREMYRVASQLRMGSTEALLQEAGRVVRATGAALGKQVACVTGGEQERVEMPILDALSDALLHLVRNAVAHGVGTPERRVSQGKPPGGTVWVEVTRVGAEVVFRCRDDGKGIAVEPIRKAAVARGELTAGSAAAATDEELLRLLLRPGFSLHGGVDEVSGRGVGLDAVAEAAARVRGRVTIESKVGVGTTFTITVPQTAFAAEALELRAAGCRYAVPLRRVEQTFRLETHPTGDAGQALSLRVGKEIMSFLWLQDAFAGGGNYEQGVCVVLNAGGKRVALGVERLDGLSEALVQPVSRFAGVADYVAGMTVGSDGVLVPVLDVEALMAVARQGVGRKAGPATTSATAQRLPILVIDDSLTTRMLEQSILEAEGYDVEVAVHAEMGLEMARRKRYGLFLVDVEMPGMSGYDFVTIVTADPVLKETPAILVTSLDSAESRERGRVAGAYSYIVKGEFNQEIYLDRIRSVVGAGRP